MLNYSSKCLSNTFCLDSHLELPPSKLPPSNFQEVASEQHTPLFWIIKTSEKNLRINKQATKRPGKPNLLKEFYLPLTGLSVASGLMSACEMSLNNCIFLLSISGPDFATFEKTTSDCSLQRDADFQWAKFNQGIMSLRSCTLRAAVKASSHCTVSRGRPKNLCRAERTLRSMGVLLSHGTKHINMGLEEATRGLRPCDTLRFSHPPPNMWVPQTSDKRKSTKTLKLDV